MPLPYPARLNVHADAVELLQDGHTLMRELIAGRELADVVRDVLTPHRLKVRLDVLINVSHVRMFMLPYGEALSSEARWDAFAAGQFTQLYDETPEAWVLRVVADRPGRPRLAVALPRALMETMKTLLGLRLRCIHVDALGRMESVRMNEPRFTGALLDMGPAHALLMFLVDGMVQRVRMRRVIPSLEELRASLMVEWAALAPTDGSASALPCLALGPGAQGGAMEHGWDGVASRLMKLG